MKNHIAKQRNSSEELLGLKASLDAPEQVVNHLYSHRDTVAYMKIYANVFFIGLNRVKNYFLIFKPIKSCLKTIYLGWEVRSSGLMKRRSILTFTTDPYRRVKVKASVPTRSR